MTPNKSIRIEHDLLCDLEIPAQAYYGVHTLRALHNFLIAGTPISKRRIGGTHRLLR
jgi:aspartate ammonia-lyase